MLTSLETFRSVAAARKNYPLIKMRDWMLPDAQAGEYNYILRDFSVTVEIKNAVENRYLNIKRMF